ncbi:MAG: cardiolipin synthase [Deltaproteobacteria bacterium]|nr:cardiolipin synthase [Deltaproteobacteria bacterium]
MWVLALTIGLQLVVVFGFVLRERREPQATLAWILGVVLVPFVGVLTYFFFGIRRVAQRHRQAERVAARVRDVYSRYRVAQKTAGIGAAGTRAPAEPPMKTRSLVQLASRVSEAYACAGNAVDMLVDGARTYDAIRAAISRARDHVHVEFYIIQPDESGRALRDHLVEIARAGVQVRVLCDALGSLKLPADFWEPLVAVGGQAAYFGPIRFGPFLRRRDHVNFRNHRKIVVVDGRVGLTGGINIGREYLGLDPRIGAWRDTHIRIEGPAVLGLQQTFIEDWLHATGELLDHARFFPEPPTPAPGEAMVQCVASGPDRPWAVIHQMHFLACAASEKRIWATSPYFVPDRVIQSALVTAALRGVDVRLLVPRRSDSRLVDWASRYYFGELLESGVRVFEYDRGFLHAKSLVVDDWVAAIGSSNMDIRSFQLNYELTAFVYDRDFAQSVARQYALDLANATELPRRWLETQSYGKRLLHAAAGLLSPLL